MHCPLQWVSNVQFLEKDIQFHLYAANPLGGFTKIPSSILLPMREIYLKRIFAFCHNNQKADTKPTNDNKFLVGCELRWKIMEYKLEYKVSYPICTWLWRFLRHKNKIIVWSNVINSEYIPKIFLPKEIYFYCDIIQNSRTLE